MDLQHDDSTRAAMDAVVARVCEALVEFTRVCVDSPEDSQAVVLATHPLRRAVEAFDHEMGERTGWSAPLRWRWDEPLAFFDEASVRAWDRPAVGAGDAAVVEVAAKYVLSAADITELARALMVQLGDEVEDVQDGVTRIYKRDSWDPLRYNPGWSPVWSVRDVQVAVTIDRATPSDG
jgi:hypothetical protein